MAALDKAAGHCNNLKKAAALVTTSRAGILVDQFRTDDQVGIPVRSCDVLVG